MPSSHCTFASSHKAHWYYLNWNVYQFHLRSSSLILEFSRKQHQPYHRGSTVRRRSNNRAAILPLEWTYSPVTLTTVMCGPFMLEGHNFTPALCTALIRIFLFRKVYRVVIVCEFWKAEILYIIGNFLCETYELRSPSF